MPPLLERVGAQLHLLAARKHKPRPCAARLGHVRFTERGCHSGGPNCRGGHGRRAGARPSHSCCCGRGALGLSLSRSFKPSIGSLLGHQRICAVFLGIWAPISGVALKRPSHAIVFQVQVVEHEILVAALRCRPRACDPLLETTGSSMA